MSSRPPFAASAAAMLTVMLLSAPPLRAQAERTGPPRIAVVDVQQAFQKLDERAAVEADIVTQTEALQKEEQERRSRIESLRADLGILDPDSEAFKQTRMDLERAAIEFQAWKQFQQRKLEAEKALRMEQLYRDLTDAVARIAQRDGYDLILQKDDTYPLSNRDERQLSAMILQRKVLYVAGPLDITDQVIQVCNNAYNNRAAAAAGEADN